MQPLARRRMRSVQLAQFEKYRIEQIVDDALPATHAMESAGRLADEDRGFAQSVARRSLRQERRLEVRAELFGKVKGANAGTGHALANDVRSRDYNREHNPSMMPRRLERPRGSSFKSSIRSAGILPAPRCSRATQ